MTKIIVVHGFPGAGKSTNSARLAGEGLDGQSVVHASAGNRLRAIRLGIEASEFSTYINSPEASSPLPDEVVSGTLFELIHEARDPAFALFDGYPRFERSVDGFVQSAIERKHRLLGCISLNVTLETSVERVVGRGPRLGDRGEANDLRGHASERYQEDSVTTQLAVKRLETLGLPVERMDSEGDPEDVYAKFRAAVMRLAL